MIKKFTVLSVVMALPLASIIAFSMDTAKDRNNYLQFLENPFGRTRFEPGFVFIGKALSFITSPEVAIVVISVATYALLAFSWSRIYQRGYLGSFLSFHLSIYLFFNYFVGTAIRNGLAAALAIALFTIAVSNRSRIVKAMILVGPAFHLGAALFSMLGWFYAQIHRFRFGLFVAIGSSVIAIFGFVFILPMFLTDAHYSLWFVQGSYGTERFRSFSMLVYAVFLLLVWAHPRKDVWSGAVLVPAPLLLFYLITGLEAFHRLLMPFFFIGTAVAFQRYAPVLGRVMGNTGYLFILISGNFLGLVYAFRQWGLL